MATEPDQQAISPYRTVNHPERIVTGQLPATAYVWTVWLFVVIAAAIIMVGSAPHAVGLLIASVLLGVIALLLLARSLKARVRWRLAFDGDRLRIERFVGGVCEPVGELVLEDPIRVHLELEPNPLSFDVAITVSSARGELTWDSGLRAAVAAEHVVDFLIDNGVAVERPAPRRLGWKATGP